MSEYVKADIDSVLNSAIQWVQGDESDFSVISNDPIERLKLRSELIRHRQEKLLQLVDDEFLKRWMNSHVAIEELESEINKHRTTIVEIEGMLGANATPGEYGKSNPFDPKKCYKNELLPKIQIQIDPNDPGESFHKIVRTASDDVIDHRQGKSNTFLNLVFSRYLFSDTKWIKTEQGNIAPESKFGLVADGELLEYITYDPDDGILTVEGLPLDDSDKAMRKLSFGIRNAGPYRMRWVTDCFVRVAYDPSFAKTVAPK